MPVSQLPSARETLELLTLLPGPREQVYACWTEPALLQRWWPAVAVTDPRSGGTYHFAWPTQGWHLRGRYLACDPTSGLRFTWRWDHNEEGEAERIVRVTYGDDPNTPGQVRLLLTHGPYGSSAAEQAVRLEHHLTGWQFFLPRLEQVLRDERERAAGA